MRSLSCEAVRGSQKPHSTHNPSSLSAAAVLPSLLMGAFVCWAVAGWAQTPPQLPDGNGKETIQKACGSCHALTTVTNAGHDRPGWASVLNMMGDRRRAGAKRPDCGGDRLSGQELPGATRA
jgi:hypothetical protein